ncbi:ABC transporter C-terminal domain-containing protein, partial [Mesorhizobium japonicum]|uniref:ABC transporter C-terminal domain-containing protein n=1 Tax=Mesorhizobium japonicum TaxID=2066070 RepID=UPI003B5CA880
LETSSVRSGGLEGEAASAARPALVGAARRDAEKELASLDRRLARLGEQIAAQHAVFAEHDQSDYVGLGELQARLAELESETAVLEERWLEVSERLDQ